MQDGLIASFKQQLAAWSASGELSRAIQYDLTGGETLPEDLKQDIDSWGNNVFEDLPAIQIVDKEELQGHLGAYSSTNATIYLNSALLNNPQTAEIVLTHEFGHYITDKHFDPHSEKRINNFVGSLIPTAYGVFDALNNAADTGAKSTNLPNGEKLDIEYFKTELHNALDSEVFLFLNDYAKQKIATAQNNTDDINTNNKFSLQFRAAAHFDNNDIAGGTKIIYNWYEDALNRFYATEIPESKWTSTSRDLKKGAKSNPTGINFQDENWKSGRINPAFTGENAGLELLLYRFGQILHVWQDFYTHTTWTTLLGEAGSRKPFRKGTLFDQEYGMPKLRAQGEAITGNLEITAGSNKYQTVYITGSDFDWSKVLKVAATVPTLSFGGGLKEVLKNTKKFANEAKNNSLSWQKFLFGINDEKFYWRVNSDLTQRTDTQGLKDPTLKATTLQGKDVFGLASGETWSLLYKDKDYNVPLIDTSKLGIGVARAIFAGLDHGGFAGTQNVLIPDPYNPTSKTRKYNPNLGPVARDLETDPGHDEAMELAMLQTQHEWDRLGNLIFSKHGEAGLRRFADYALSETDRETYVKTYSVIGGKYTDFSAWPDITYETPNKTYFSASYQNDDTTTTNFQFRLIVEASKDQDSGDIVYRPQVQYSSTDDPSGAWIDSANTEAFLTAERHEGLTSDILNKVISPKTTTHEKEASRAFWSEDNNDDGADGLGTIYFIESRNMSTIPIFIDNFQLGLDKIVIVDDSGNRIAEIGHHWGESNYKLGRTDAIEKYNVDINARPTAFRNDPAWIISTREFTNTASISADAFFHDCDEEAGVKQSLVFNDLTSNAPFLKLVDGKLIATSEVLNHSGKEFLATVSATDGVGGGDEDLIRIVVDPSLTLSGSTDAIQSGQLFDISFTSQNSEAFAVYAAININDGQDDVDHFTTIASVAGSVAGNPAGYNVTNQRVKLGDASDSGSVKFMLQDSYSSEFTELTAERDHQGTIKLSNGDKHLATLKPITDSAAPGQVPHEIGRFSFRNGTGSAAGFMLNTDSNNEFALNYSTYSSAAYSTRIGFYLTDVRYGKIVDPMTGHFITYDQSKWADSVNQYKVLESDLVKNNATHQSVIKLDHSIDARNIIFTPYFKTTADKAEYIYGADAALNPDGLDHLIKLGDGVFGFEDMYGLGDKDYNDVIFKFNSIQSLQPF